MILEWKIQSIDEGKLVRDFLLHDRAFSNRLLKDIKKNGEILIDNQPITVRHALKKGNILTVKVTEELNYDKIKPIQMKLNIVYEDNAILVLNKPRGIAVLPNMNDDITLVNGLARYYDKQGIKSAIHIVTRIDKWTSGLVLIAKNKYYHHLLSQQNIHREYRAIIEGRLNQPKGVIDYPISRNLPSIIERKVDPNGKRAITHFQVLKEMNKRSFIRVELETGRTHQIRVHFSYIGHPLIGDDLYGSRLLLIRGQALHARLIRFNHPARGHQMTCVASYPNDFSSLII